MIDKSFMNPADSVVIFKSNFSSATIVINNANDAIWTLKTITLLVNSTPTLIVDTDEFEWVSDVTMAGCTFNENDNNKMNRAAIILEHELQRITIGGLDLFEDCTFDDNGT